MRVLRDKKVLLTGAAGGCGQAMARRFAKEGARLFLVDVDAVGLQSIADECRSVVPDVHAVECDLMCPKRISALTRRLVSTWGKLDILINNAGVCYYGKWHHMSDKQWDTIQSVNLNAPIQLTRELLPALLANRESHVLNVSSMYGYMTTPRCAAYHTTKFALIGLSEALRMEYCRAGLGVTVLCPGFIKTGFFARTSTAGASAPSPPAWLCASPDSVARAAITAIRRNRRFVTVTALARIMHWTRRLSPGLLDKLSRIGRPVTEHGRAKIVAEAKGVLQTSATPSLRPAMQQNIDRIDTAQDDRRRAA